MNIQKKLIEVLSQKATSPFFFLGSGFSRRYIGLEKWDELLKVFADKVGKPYGYYKSNANGNLPQVASLIAKDFQDKIWSDEKFFSFPSNPQLSSSASFLRLNVLSSLN